MADIQQNVPLAPLTTIGIGGMARYLMRAETVDDLRSALAWAAEQQAPVFILGGGSNVLVADQGWPGLVIQMALPGIEFEQTADAVRVISGAGVNWDDLVAETVKRGLQGIECLSGIPGTVGASPIQNIGAYGQEVAETIAWVEALERTTGELHRFAGSDCGFAYRWSRFKGEDAGRFIVTRVAFDLRPGETPSLRYGDLTRHFAAEGVSDPTLQQVRDAVIAVRRSKGMVVAPDLPDSRSCGSFFMNPIVPLATAEHVRQVALAQGLMQADDRMPEFPAGEGLAKLSAAWLMERAGLRRGEAHGNVGLSSRHVLALINRGGGSSAEIQALVKQVQDTVSGRFGVDLHPEPVFVGFERP